VNAKICFVEIGAQGTTIDQATKDRLAALIEQATTQTAATVQSTTAKRQYVFGSYVDEPVMMVSGAGTKHYFHQNHLYSVAAMTSSTGAVVERYRYDAYGKRTVTNAAGTPIAASTIGQQRGFTGYYLDAETGLYYARARMYSVGIGRFIGRDPWRAKYDTPNPGDGYNPGLNLYEAQFVPNELDPDGTTPCSQLSINYTLPGTNRVEKTLGYGPFGMKIRGGYATNNIQFKALGKKCCCDSYNNRYEGAGRLEGEMSAWIFIGWYASFSLGGNDVAVKIGGRAIGTMSVQGTFSGYYDECEKEGGLKAEFTLRGTAGVEGYGYAALRTFWGWEWEGEARFGGRAIYNGSGSLSCDLNQCTLKSNVTIGAEIYYNVRLSSVLSHSGQTGVYGSFDGAAITFASPVKQIFN